MAAAAAIRFYDNKGNGFIKPDPIVSDDKDLFVHHTLIRCEGSRSLFIDRDFHPHRLLFLYTNALDDDNQQQDCASTLSMITKQFTDLRVIGSSRGFLCLHGRSIPCGGEKVVLWNPCLPNPVVIAVPSAVPFADDDDNILIGYEYGFGVCPVTNDPTILRIQYPNPYAWVSKPTWHTEVFTLSTGVWNALPCSNIPQDLDIFGDWEVAFRGFESSQFVTDSFIYWVASTLGKDDQGYGCWVDYIILSFDLIAKEFRVVADIKFSLNIDLGQHALSISKLKESLVVFVNVGYVCDVYKMEPDGSFTKLFIINKPDDDDFERRILGFRKNGEIVMEAADKEFVALETYDPCKERISTIGIYGIGGSLELLQRNIASA